MKTGGRMVVIAVFAAGLILLAMASAKPESDEIPRVLVTNFPQTQEVTGRVSVKGTVRHASFEQFKGIVVPPVDPEDTRRLIDGGVLETEGFTSVVLSLNAATGGRMFQPGSVGVILTPEEETIEGVLEEEGQHQFALRAEMALEPDSSRSFASDPTRLMVAFPRYRVHFYNSTDKNVKANLFAYLTN